MYICQSVRCGSSNPLTQRISSLVMILRSTSKEMNIRINAILANNTVLTQRAATTLSTVAIIHKKAV